MTAWDPSSPESTTDNAPTRRETPLPPSEPTRVSEGADKPATPALAGPDSQTVLGPGQVAPTPAMMTANTPFGPGHEPQDPSANLPQSLQQRYRMIRVLGKGGFANVYLANDSVLDQQVAIKILKLGLASKTDHERFLQEARIGAKLRHPNIATVFDIIQTPDGLQLIMEYYPAGTLTDRIKARGALKPREAVEIIRQVAQALAYAHRHAFVHRDIKPANIFLTADGMVKLGDFGIAAHTEVHEYTQTGVIIGTPLYMAPEQSNDSRDVDPRTDIYALGLTLYHMLTGRPPRVVDLDRVPAPFRKLIKASTEPNRNERLVSAEQFIAMLDQIELKTASVPAANAESDPEAQDSPSSQPPAYTVASPTPAQVSAWAPPTPTPPLEPPPSDTVSTQTAPAAPTAPPPTRRLQPAWLAVAALCIVIIPLLLLYAQKNRRQRSADQAQTAASVTPGPTPLPAAAPTSAPTALPVTPQPTATPTPIATANPTATPSVTPTPPTAPMLSATPTPAVVAAAPSPTATPLDPATAIIDAVDGLRQANRGLNSALNLLERLDREPNPAMRNINIQYALTAIEGEVQRVPKDPILHLLAGLVNERAGKPDEALEHYIKACELDRTAPRPLGLTRRGIVALRHKQGLPVGPFDQRLLLAQPARLSTRP